MSSFLDITTENLENINLDGNGYAFCVKCLRIAKPTSNKNCRYINVFVSKLPYSANVGCVKVKRRVSTTLKFRQRVNRPGLGNRMSMSTTEENTQIYIPSRNHFDLLPDEIILNIFQKLPQNQLRNVASVCHRFKRITQDDSLWQVADLTLCEIDFDRLREIMRRPVKLLRLVFTSITSPEILTEQQATDPDDLWGLIHLDFTEATVSPHTVTAILNKCRNLKKLSLPGISVDENMMLALAANKNLEVLILRGASGVTIKTLKILFGNCTKLKQLNLPVTKLSQRMIEYICKNLPSGLKKLNLTGWSLEKEHVEQLVQTCPHLQELDLSFNSTLTLDIVPILHTLNELVFLNISYCDIPLEPLVTLKELKEGVHVIIHDSYFCRYEQFLR